MNSIPNKVAKAIKSIGPGLLFASSSIGTSHLVLSTRAGAHHGMIFFWIILLCLFLKYPLFEFAPRYVAATGNSLLKAYRDQGMWAVVLFIGIITISMFAVVGAVGAVSAGILSTMGGMSAVPMESLTGIILLVTAAILFIGGYRFLDTAMKWLSAVLLISVIIAFIAVIIRGPVDQNPAFQSPTLFEGAGLALLISLLGWMPTGMEASAMHSFWVLEKEKVMGHQMNLRESLFDFNLGYGLTILLALMFMMIGAFTIYGSGNLLDGNSTQMSNKLLNVFTSNIGAWSYPVILIAAFGTIYGTLITAWDAFTRSFVRSLRVFKFGQIDKTTAQSEFIEKLYRPVMILIGIGGYFLFRFASSNMITILQGATIFSFVASPILAYFNLKAIQSPEVSAEFRPSSWKIVVAWIGLLAMIAFSVYYLYSIAIDGVGGH